MKNKDFAKDIALIGTLASVAGVFRVPFAFIPSVQPTTFMVMMTGYVFGPKKGFLTGIIAAFVSNIFLGQGTWTPFQMLCWGLTGFTAGILGKEADHFNTGAFTILGFVWGYLFGWIMNLYYWIGFVYPLSLKSFLLTYSASFILDSMHGIGNVAFSLLFGMTFYKILMRYKKKLYPDIDGLEGVYTNV